MTRPPLLLASAVAMMASCVCSHLRAQTTATEPANTAVATPSPVAPSPATSRPLASAGGDQMMRYPPSSVRVGLVLGGTAVLATAYGLGVLTSQLWDDVPGSESMVIPFAGPWLALANNDCSPDTPDCGAMVHVRGVLLVVDALAQLGGLALIGEGLLMTTEADSAAPPEAAWSVAPSVSPSHAGVAVSGSF